MIGLNVMFWMMVILFGVIGSMRGWAKELLVSFAVILALFIATVLEKFVPPIREGLALDSTALFWMRALILIALVAFGYQTPNLPKLAGNPRFARERLQDILLGVFLGAVNGYLIFGSLWSFMVSADYPFEHVILSPIGTQFEEATNRLLSILPPSWLGTSPAIYFAVAIAFVFVLVVFI